jgi:chromosome segregation protein
MKIKKLDIIGFKSFVDKASIAFPEGISAIVGPNGCGKSNVIDALRWVMGEQSVKQLRGKAMEDIIFAGANGKPPLNMAEVTITLANDNGHAPEEFKDFSEISVTRRLFRSGESAYLINRQPCRLKDIYNLFMGSGVGTRTFAIIQQGNIGAIIDAGPDERRLFIEEAAGVTRYKFRKNEALRKVTATEQNLLRLHDIIAEVNRQMAGLSRQAKKAERYAHLKKRSQLIDIQLLLHYYDESNQGIAETDTLLRDLRDADLGHVTQLKKIDAAVEQIKLKRLQKNQEIAAQKSHQFEIQRRIDRDETERNHLKSEIDRLSTETAALGQARQELETKSVNMGAEVTQVETQNRQLQQDVDIARRSVDEERAVVTELQAELSHYNQQMEGQKNALMQLVADEARYKNIYQNASTNKENIKRRLKRIDEEVLLAGQKASSLTTEKSKAQSRLDLARSELSTQDKHINDIRSTLATRATELGAQVKQTQTCEMERNKSRSQLTALKKMAANYDWYRDGVKAVMRARQTSADSSIGEQRPALSGVIGVMADLIEPAPGYETAVEAVLGEALQYILVDDQQAGIGAIEFLQSRQEGRGGFIPIGAVKPVPASTGTQDAEDLLLDHVNVAAGHEAIAQALLGHVCIVPSLADALAQFNRNGRVRTLVTPEGQIVSHQGVLIGGSQDKMAGILAKKMELKEIEERCALMDIAAAEAQARQQAMEVNVRQLETDLQQAIVLKNRMSDEALEAEKALFRLGEELKTAQRHLEIVQLEQEQLMGEESDLDEEMMKYNQALARITSDVQKAQEQSAAAVTHIAQLNQRLELHNQKVVDLKLHLTTLNARLETGIQTLVRLKDFERDSHQRLAQLAAEISQKQTKQTSAQAKLAATEKELQELYHTHQNLDVTLSTHQSEYHSIDAALQENDQRITAIQSDREKTLEKIRLVELDLSEKRMRRENIAAKSMERYHCSLADLRAQCAQPAEPIQMSIQEMEKELERYRAKMKEIGDVNMGAIAEYEQLKERFDFLSRHRDDLVKAIEDLHKVIRKINRITQQRFMETFEQVNEKLQEVFPKLFEGGSAHLQLSAPDKPLETGVEFLVHPPGKKLTRMSLLSGGEKALSAIAFIFAIFLIRPASFCLLDEIDAPLDEANVIRFNNLMQLIGQKSQIIMITHNKKSMEFADTLFGVTMEQKGVSKLVSVNLQAKEA